MAWKFTPYAVPLFIGSALLLEISIMAWMRRRTARGAAYLMLSCMALAIYVLGYAFELGATTAEDALFWLKIEYIGEPFSPAFLLMLALAFTGYRHYLTPFTRSLLLAYPILTALLAWTNEYHELIWPNITIDRSGGYTASLFERDLWNWALVSLYPYACSTGALMLFGASFRRATGLYRSQLLVILAGMGIALTLNSIYVFGLGPPGLDLSPYGFSATAIAAAIAMLNLQLFDVVPVAQTRVLAGMRDAIIVLDGHKRVVDINNAAQNALGLDATTIVGKTGASTLPQLIMTVVGVTEKQTEILLPPRNFYDLRHFPLHRQAGQIAGHVLILRDITARTEAEVERERLIRELDAYAHTVAHDLKNPLMVVASYGMLLQEEFREQTPDEIAENLDVIVETSERMTNIVDELLLLAGVRQLSEVPHNVFDMRPIVENALQRVRVLAENAGAVITVQEVWPTAWGYGPWVEEIWANYLSNAVKYGGQPPRIALGADAPVNNVARFWVRDNGPGLTPDEQQAIFTRFTRLHTVRAEGSGLGLSIVHRIATKLGGTVGVESLPDEGSLFYFTLRTAPPLDQE